MSRLKNKDTSFCWSRTLLFCSFLKPCHFYDVVNWETYTLTGNTSQLSYRHFKFTGLSDSLKTLRKETLNCKFSCHRWRYFSVFDYSVFIGTNSPSVHVSPTTGGQNTQLDNLFPQSDKVDFSWENSIFKRFCHFGNWFLNFILFSSNMDNKNYLQRF